MPEKDLSLREKFFKMVDDVSSTPEFQVWKDVLGTAKKGLDANVKVGTALFNATSPMAYALKGAGNPKAEGDLLGQVGPTGGAGLAVVDKTLLSAGGKRVYDSLKDLASKKKWAQKAASYLEGDSVTTERSSDILESISTPGVKPQGWDNQKRNFTTDGNVEHFRKNNFQGQPLLYNHKNAKVPGIGPARIEELRANIVNVPLPETTFSIPPEFNKEKYNAIQKTDQQIKAQYEANRLAKKQQWANEPTEKSKYVKMPDGGIRWQSIKAIPGEKSPLSPSHPTGKLKPVSEFESMKRRLTPDEEIEVYRLSKGNYGNSEAEQYRASMEKLRKKDPESFIDRVFETAAFRDYDIHPAENFGKINDKASINLIDPDEADLLDALETFNKDGYSKINVFLSKPKKE